MHQYAVTHSRHGSVPTRRTRYISAAGSSDTTSLALSPYPVVAVTLSPRMRLQLTSQTDDNATPRTTELVGLRSKYRGSHRCCRILNRI